MIYLGPIKEINTNQYVYQPVSKKVCFCLKILLIVKLGITIKQKNQSNITL